MSTKELTVIFGGETQRARYIREGGADPKTVITACYPHILGIMQVGEDVSFKVIRCPEEEWGYIKYAFEEQIAKTEERLKQYQAEGKQVTEVVL